MKILIIAEHDNHQPKPAMLSTITAAKQLGDDITVLVAGENCQAAAENVAKISGVTRVVQLEGRDHDCRMAENLSVFIAKLINEHRYTHVLAPATTFGKNFMPRVAALLDVAQISDVAKIISADTFIRPIYAGNVLATVQSHDPIKVLTIRAAKFAPAMAGDQTASIDVRHDLEPTPNARFVKQALNVSLRPELSSARVVISGGRGLQSSENFKMLEALADRLGAAIGASRAAVDAGFVPNDYQVGQTGKVVAPELYIAIGISGAIQHLAGMKDSKVIVAINKDPEAPIFQIADYGLVGDLFTLIPQLTEELGKI